MSNEIKRYASEDCVDSKINSIFEKHNTFTIEYAEPIKISLADIPIFNKVISNGTATYGTVEIVDGQTFIYTPTTYLLGAETVVLTFDDNTTYDVYINPADHIYYDASFFNIADATGWSYVEDETGSYAVATVDTGTNQLVPHFVGTGFALYGKYSLDDGALCTLLVERTNSGSTLARNATNGFNGYNVPVYEKVISEHDTWDVRIVRNKSNPESAKLELSGIRIYNTIYDESSPSFTSVAEKVKKSNSDTNGTATSVIYLTYNTETKAFDRTLFDSALSNSQVYHAFEINKTGDNPKIWVSANAQPNKSTLSSVDSYNDNIAVSHSKSTHLNDDVMKFVPLEIVNYSGKNYVLISSPTGITALGAIKYVDCEIVTQTDQAAVDAFVEDVIRIANGTLIATMETAKQLEDAIEKLDVQPDWNQNDPEAKDYVKNRTHWSDEIILLEEQTFEFAADPFGCYSIQTSIIMNFVPGEKYVVLFDGQRHEYIASNSGTLGSAYEEGDLIQVAGYGAEGKIAFTTTDTTSTSHTVGIIQETLHTIDTKYLPQPDMVITVNGVPDPASKPSLTDISITSGSFEALENLIRSGTVPNVVVRFCQYMNHVGEIPPYLVEASEYKAAINWYGSAVRIKIIVSNLSHYLISYRFLYEEGELSLINMYSFEGTSVS